MNKKNKITKEIDKEIIKKKKIDTNPFELLNSPMLKRWNYKKIIKKTIRKTC